MRKLAAASILVVVAVGCGYRARFDLPPHLRTFSVATFVNKTLERNVDFMFTQVLIREIHAKTPLRVATPGTADLVITGEIAEFDRDVLRRKLRKTSSSSEPEPVDLDQGDDDDGEGGTVEPSSCVRHKERELKSELRHRLFVNVTMQDRKKGVMFFEGKRITRRVEIRLNRGDTSRMARDELVRELARRVASLAFERWPGRGMEATARAR